MQEQPGTFTEEVNPKEDIKAKLNRLKDHAGDYVDTYVQIAKVKAVKGASTAAAGIVLGITVFFFAFFVLLFSGFGLGWWLGNLLENRAAGFFAAAGIYLVLLALAFALRRKIIIPAIQKMIISKVYE